MKLTRITIEDFRSLNHVELDLSDTTAVALFGRNAEGKSSVLNALQMALVGYCEHTDRRGSGAAALIRDGAREARIVIEFETGRANRPLAGVECVLHRSAKEANEWRVYDPATGEVSEKIQDRTALWRWLNVPDRFHLPALMPAAFLAGPDCSDVLAHFLGGDHTAQDVLDYAGEHAPFVTEFASAHGAALDTRDGLESLGKAAYDSRTGLNREIKTAQALVAANENLAAPVDADGQRLTVGDDEALQTDIHADNERLAALQRQLGLAEAPDASGERASLEERLTVRRSNLTVQERKLTKHDATVTAAREQLEAATTALREAQWEAEHARSAASEAQAEIDALPEADAECPTCKQKLRPKVLETVRSLLVEKRDAAAAALDTAAAKVQACTSAETGARNQYEHDQMQRTNCQRGIDALNEEIYQIEGQIESLPGAYDGLSVEELRSQIATIEQRLERNRTALQRLREWTELEQNRAFLASSSTRVDELTWICKAFKDGEFVKSRSSGMADTLTALVNRTLAPWNLSIEVDVQGKRVDLLLVEDGRSRPVHLCSSGQQALVQYAVASAYATHGVPVLLDDINHLDAERRKTLLAALAAVAEGTVIVAGAWQQSRTDWAQVQAALAELHVYVVADGVVTPAAAAQQVAA